MKALKIIAAIAAAAALLAGCTANSAAEVIMDQSSNSQVVTLKGLSGFSATALDGSSFGDGQLASHDLTVMVFWSPLCGPCLDELTQLQTLAAGLPSSVQVVTVCLDGRGYEEDVTELLSKAGYTGVTLMKGDDTFMQFSSQIQYTPTTIMLDGTGAVVGPVMIGASDSMKEDCKTAIDTALKDMGRPGL